MIEIEDTGIGLTESAMSKLYSPFMQAQRLAGGTGLGLFSLAKRLDALGGHYGVESRKDGMPGAMFWFAIPYREDVDAASACKISRQGSSRLEDLILAAQVHGTGPGMEADVSGKDTSSKSENPNDGIAMNGDYATSSRGSSSMGSSTRTSTGSFPPMHPSFLDSVTIVPLHERHLRVLLVDDSESILKVTTLLLARSGHSVDRAENGVIALDKLAASLLPDGKPFDVVIMDLQMPVLDGLEATRRLRELEEGRIALLEEEANARASAKQAAAALKSVAEQAEGLSAAEQGKEKIERHAERKRDELLGRRQIVIGLSANGDDDTMQAAYTAGVDQFIEKPFTIKKMLEALQDIQK